MRNHEVTKRQLLLDDHGELREPGWARQQVWQYRRNMIKAKQLKQAPKNLVSLIYLPSLKLTL